MPKTATAAIHYAYSHIGDHEDPVGSNETVFNEWFGMHHCSWCAIFFSFIVVGQCGVSLPGSGPKGFSSCEQMHQAALEHGYFVKASELQPGDGLLYHVNGGHAGANHTGLFVEYFDSSHQHVRAVDGNTSPTAAGDQRNGDGVYEKVRPVGMVLGGVRPGYAKAEIHASSAAGPKPIPRWYSKPHRLGDRDQEVASIAKRLKLSPPRVTFDHELDAAVRYVQRAHHLPVDGVVGPDTARAIG